MRTRLALGLVCALYATRVTAEVGARGGFQAAAAKSLPPAGDPDRTLAPYFFVEGGRADREVFPLKRSHAAIHVVDAIAEVRLTQAYRNEGSDTIEAIYLFPLSTRAAVHALKMTIGDRVIEAKIRERDQARATYDAARARGQAASLLEQMRPNVFQMSLANVRPGDEVRVELAYMERLVPEERTYELVFPTVVGPRYSNVPAAQARPDQAWVEQPYVAGSAPRVQSSIEVVLEGGLPITSLKASHERAMSFYESAGKARVVLAPGDDRQDRDFVLRFARAGGAIASGATIERHGEDRWFAITVEPPARVTPAEVLPREYVFIVDISGSMAGFPLGLARDLMRRLGAGLRPIDRINVLTFAGASELLAPSSLPATRANLERAQAFLDRHHAGGGTELLPALQRALALPRSENTSRIVTVITDGYVSIESEAFALVRRSLGQANLFAFGVGSAVNRHLIEGLARAGAGEAFVVESQAGSAEQVARFAEYVRAPVLTGLAVRYEGLSVFDVEPPSLPDVFASRPVVLQGRLRGAPRGRIVVSGRTAAGAYAQTIELASAREVTGDALSLLWARQRIARISDEAGPEERAKSRLAVIALGLSHHLMTEHTSFVAVDSAVRGGGEARRVEQPLAMPAGVEAASVLGMLGSGSGSASVFGGGGTGEGTIGLGTLGTLGHGGGGGIGYGRGAGGLGMRRAAAPQVTIEAPKVRGALDAELVRRVVRRHMNELRFLYEKALLARNGKPLAGRVVVRFTIDAQGLVSASEVVESSLGTPALEAEIAASFRRWQFPKGTAGAPIIIVYPLRFGAP